MRRARLARLLLLLGSAGAVVVALAGPASPRSSATPLEAIVSTCPSAADVAVLDAALSLQWETDPTAGTTACTATQSGRPLTVFQERVYQSLLVLQRLRYSKPLPWTSQTLYDWFTHAIVGIRFRGDVGSSFCCSPENVIDIHTGVAIAQAAFPFGPGSALNFISLLAHEARHNEAKPHTCGSFDQTVEEQGALAIQLELALWNALYSDSLLDDPGQGQLHTTTRDGEFDYARSFLTTTSFCNLAKADLSTERSAPPETLPAGSTFTFGGRMKNSGPASAPNAVLYFSTPTGATATAATASPGSCTVHSDRTVCELGVLRPGETAKATVTYTLTAKAGTMVQGGAYRYAQVNDTSANNDDIFFVIKTTAAKPKAKCKKGQKPTKKKPCRP